MCLETKSDAVKMSMVDAVMYFEFSTSKANTPGTK